MFKKISHTINVVKSELREKRKSKRSSGWDELRDEVIKKHASCAACGSKKKLQVHHIIPFSNRPELEMDEGNLIVLCMDEFECHLAIGHGGAFKFYNPNVVEDAQKFLISNSDVRQLITEYAKTRRLN